jgi:hypothetical protein
LGTSADILLVGSVPLESAEAVLRTCGHKLGSSVVALPDGETGDRTIWVVYQAFRVFHQHPDIETLRRPAPINGKEQWIPAGLDDLWSFKIRDAVRELRFDDLRYASVARDSYETFRRLRDRGDIAPGVRFQVCLPLPESGFSWFFHDPSQLKRVLPAYADAMSRELDKITGLIPPSDLSIQWDVCWEVLDAEGIFPWAMRDEEGPLARFGDMCARMSSKLPDQALLGYHLCYADLGNRHMKEPENLALCVQMANIAASRSNRRVDFFHMPVPVSRDDDAYFEPLGNLSIHDAKVFLGLVHSNDGIEGTRRRITTARRHLDTFGVATECGFGRRPSEQIPELLEIHVQAIRELQDSSGRSLAANL